MPRPVGLSTRCQQCLNCLGKRKQKCTNPQGKSLFTSADASLIRISEINCNILQKNTERQTFQEAVAKLSSDSSATLKAVTTKVSQRFTRTLLQINKINKNPAGFYARFNIESQKKNRGGDVSIDSKLSNDPPTNAVSFEQFMQTFGIQQMLSERLAKKIRFNKNKKLLIWAGATCMIYAKLPGQWLWKYLSFFQTSQKLCCSFVR